MHRTKWFTLTLSFVGATGCEARDTTIDRISDPCAALAVNATGATSTQRGGIADALVLWRGRGATALGTGGPADATIEIRFEEAAPSFHGHYDDETGVIYINARITDPATLAIVVAHELGHAFGLPHVDDRISLMNRGNLVTPPTEADEHALAALWGRCAAALP
ncbi:MAG: matrixin family metalloprotease [Deltaproteobacteria bacterium]|nr:matrixin family metalloprotease [Deltaproteobacteria bacterium]MDQ3297129.1 matrixin family metalloprotease [Myxococcota bacterium]